MATTMPLYLIPFFSRFLHKSDRIVFAFLCPTDFSWQNASSSSSCWKCFKMIRGRRVFQKRKREVFKAVLVKECTYGESPCILKDSMRWYSEKLDNEVVYAILGNVVTIPHYLIAHDEPFKYYNWSEDHRLFRQIALEAKWIVDLWEAQEVG